MRARACYSKNAHALVAYARARTICLHHVDKVTVKATEKERLVLTFIIIFFFSNAFWAQAYFSSLNLTKYGSGGLVMHYDM